MRMQTSDASAVKKKAELNLAQAGMRDSRMIWVSVHEPG